MQPNLTPPSAPEKSSHASSMCHIDVEFVPASCFSPGTFRQVQRSSAEVFSDRLDDLPFSLAGAEVLMLKRPALDLVLEALNLGIGVIDDLVKLIAKMRILVGEVLAHGFIVQSEQVNGVMLCQRVEICTSLALFGTPKMPGHVQHIP